jgi:hypothetical protein
MGHVNRWSLLVFVVVSTLAGCGGDPSRQWYKPGAEYTLQEFKRDQVMCSKAGTLDEACLRERGWVPLSADVEVRPKEPEPERVPRQRSR